MPRPLNWLLSKLTIHKTFHFHGSTEALHAQLLQLAKYKWSNGFFFSRFVSENYYKVEATLSLGTMTSGGRGNAGIRLHLKIEPRSEVIQQINVFTKVRPENWFLVALFIFFYIGAIVSGEDLYTYIYLFALSIICLLWFNFVYKVQERILLEKVVKNLKLTTQSKKPLY